MNRGSIYEQLQTTDSPGIYTLTTDEAYNVS